MKEVKIDGVVYVPKAQQKRLFTSVNNIPLHLWPKDVKKIGSYSNILRICEYLNNEFESDDECKWIIPFTLDEVFDTDTSITSIYHFTSKEAAEYALLHFKQTFKTFYS